MWVVADINSKISAQLLNGTVSASYVKDGTASYIKFTGASSMAFATTPASLTSLTSINSGTSSSSLLTSLGFSSGDNASFNFENGSTSYPISLAVTATTTIQNLMDSVNSATSGSITMGLDDTTGKYHFNLKASGSTCQI